MLAWLLCGVLWFSPGLSLARAQDAQNPVVIVRVPGDDTIILRVRAELSSYRFRVIELPDRPAQRSEALSQLAEKRDAQAALRAKPDAMAVQLWVRAPGSSTPASEELVSAGPGRDAEVLALRVTEAMRARGLALPPLSAAGSKAAPAPAADSSGRAGAPSATTPDASVGIAEPRTLQPGELTEPVVKAPDAVKPAVVAPAPAKPATTPAVVKPVEPQPARPEPKPASPPSKPEAETKARPKPEEKPGTAEKEPEPPPAAALQPSQVASESPLTGLREALLYAEVGAAGVLSPGPNRLGPGLDVLLSLTFRPYPTSSISLVGLIPLLSSNLDRDGESIEVRTFGIGGFGDLHLPLGRFELSAGLGALALISSVLVVMNERSSKFFLSDYPTQRLAALLGRLGASMALTPELHVTASLMAGLTVEQLRVKFPRDDTAAASAPAPDATWGSPLLLGNLSIELALPWDR